MKNKTFFNRDVILIIVFASVFILFGICTAIFARETEIETNNISNGIQGVGLLIGAVTIIFLGVNYQQQKKQIEIQKRDIKNNRSDVEFNQFLEITYKQIDYTNFYLYEKLQREFFEKNFETEEDIYSNFDLLYILVKNFKSYLSIIDELYITSRYIKKKQKKRLFTIFNQNLHFEIKVTIKQLDRILKKLPSPIDDYSDYLLNRKIYKVDELMDNQNPSYIVHKKKYNEMLLNLKYIENVYLKHNFELNKIV